MQEAEPLADFKYLLESGINQLKTDITSSQTTNVITFYNELNELYDPSDLIFNNDPNDVNSDLIPVSCCQTTVCPKKRTNRMLVEPWLNH